MQDVVFDGDCSENFIEIRDPLFLFEEKSTENPEACQPSTVGNKHKNSTNMNVE